MQNMIESMEYILHNAVHITMLLFEFIGVAVIIWTGINAVIRWFRHSPDLGIYLGKGLCLGLEFKMGGEILKTVIVRDWKEIGMVGAIILLRTALSLVLHWEIKEEKKELKEEAEESK